MLDKVRAIRAMMNDACSRATRLNEISTALAKLELERDTCLFKLLGQVRDIAVGVRQLAVGRQLTAHDLLGDLADVVEQALADGDLGDLLEVEWPSLAP